MVYLIHELQKIITHKKNLKRKGVYLMCATFPYLRGEMAKRMYTVSKMSKDLGISICSLSTKLNGKYPFTLNEAKKIKELLGTDMSLDELFKTDL